MRVQLPDGKIAEFPDGMPVEAVAEIIKGQYLNPEREISTITSKAVPTPAESMEMGKTVMRQIPAAAGDVGLSLLLKRPIAAFSSKLPMGGGLARAGLKAATAGVGSGAGEAVGQQAFGEQMDMDAIKNQMAFGAATQLGFDTLSKVAGSTLKYLKNNTIGGQLKTRQIAEELKEVTTQRAEKFVNDLAPESVRGQSNVLDDINLKMKQAELESHAEYDVYKKAIDNHFKTVGEIDIQNTYDYLYKLRDDIAGQQASGQVIKEGAEAKTEVLGGNRVRKDIALKRALFPNMGPKSIQNRVLDEILAADRNGTPIGPDTLNDLLVNVFKKGKGSAWDGLTSSERKRLEGLKEAIKQDLGYIPVEVEPNFVGTAPTARTAKEAADENFKAIKRYNAVLDIYNPSIKEDDIGNVIFKPKKFARLVFLNEGKFTKDPVLNEIWPQLKAEAEHYANVSKTLTSKEMKPHAGDNWMDNIPGSKWFGQMSAWALLDPKSQAIIRGLTKTMPGMAATELGAGATKLGTKVLGSELGFTQREDQNYWDNQ